MLVVGVAVFRDVVYLLLTECNTVCLLAERVRRRNCRESYAYNCLMLQTMSASMLL